MAPWKRSSSGQAVNCSQNLPIRSCLASLRRPKAESKTAAHSSPLTLIQNGENLGFAAGNNVGLRYTLSDPDCQYFWLLNNDTVVEPDALPAMVRLMQQWPEVGICGSLNLSYRNPREVQAQGGMTYRRWCARVRTPAPLTVDDLGTHPAHMDYVNGASMLANRAFLETVGLMEESYFLYFEELDWAMRAKGKFQLGYACDSVIYHKEGATIGSSRDRMKRSLLSDQYLSRSRVLLTRRFFPWALPSVLACVTLAAIHRLYRGDIERAKVMFSFMLQGLNLNIAKPGKLKA
jgi:GT2 family glycosyltransferase